MQSPSAPAETGASRARTGVRTLGAALLVLTGHGVIVAVLSALVFVAREQAGGRFDAGNRFAVGYAALCLLAIGQLLLLAAVAGLSWRGATGWRAGLWTGWGVGLVLVALWYFTW
jgi:hypothetical protein